MLQLSSSALAWKRRFLHVFPAQPIPFIDIDSTSQDEFDIDIKTWLSDREWTDIPTLAWRNLPTSGVLREKLSPTAYAYLTPAALMNIIYDPDYSEYSLEWILPFNKRRVSKGVWWDTFVACLTKDQTTAIIDCLVDATSAFPQQHPASMLMDEALDFWRRAHTTGAAR